MTEEPKKFIASPVEKSSGGERAIIYKSSDLYFSAYLCSLDLPLETTEREHDDNSRNGKVIFVFKIPAKDLERLKSLYFGGLGTVKVQKYVQNLRSLKSICHT